MRGFPVLTVPYPFLYNSNLPSAPPFIAKICLKNKCLKSQLLYTNRRRLKVQHMYSTIIHTSEDSDPESAYDAKKDDDKGYTSVGSNTSNTKKTDSDEDDEEYQPAQRRKKKDKDKEKKRYANTGSQGRGRGRGRGRGGRRY